jgi:hypothetical protein
MATSFTSEEMEIINYIKEGTKKLIENILLKKLNLQRNMQINMLLLKLGLQAMHF